MRPVLSCWEFPNLVLLITPLTWHCFLILQILKTKKHGGFVRPVLSCWEFPNLVACKFCAEALFPGWQKIVQNLVNLGPEKGVISKGVFSLEKSLESLESLNSLESLGNGQILLCFPQSGGSLESLESLNSLESLEMDFSEKTPFPKDPFFRTR